MTFTQNKIVKCDACGQEVPQSKIRHLRLKTCCSYQQVPVCKICWKKLKPKKQE